MFLNDILHKSIAFKHNFALKDGFVLYLRVKIGNSYCCMLYFYYLCRKI